MANTKSATKKAKQDVKRRARNRTVRAAVRSFEKNVRKAITSKDPKAAQELLLAYTSKVGKAAQKGIVHVKAASRKISRLSKQINSLAK